MARSRRNPANGAQGARRNDAGDGARRNGGSKSRRRSTKVPARKFWGDPEAPRVVIVAGGPSDEPAAVVLSLGPPPFPGQEAASRPVFESVYARAVALAGALEAAGAVPEPVATPEEPHG